MKAYQSVIEGVHAVQLSVGRGAVSRASMEGFRLDKDQLLACRNCHNPKDLCDPANYLILIT